MAERSNPFDEQLTQITSLLAQYQQERCQEIREHTSKQVQELLRDAHTRARSRMHQAVIEERRNARERYHATRARIDMYKREQRQKADKEALGQAWLMLRQSMKECWQQKPTRSQWLNNILEYALEHLPAEHWTIEHAPGWPRPEQQEVCRQISELAGYEPELTPNDQLSGGLRICAGGTCVDSTVEGLLGQHRVVESTLLNELHLARSNPAPAAAGWNSHE